MAIRRTILTLALLAAIAAGSAGAEARVCGGCHTAHYATLGACVACHRGNASATRKDLAHDRLLRGAAAAWSMRDGRARAAGGALRAALGCRRCHTSGGQGNALAIELDRVVWKRGQDELRASILRPVTFMPDFALTTDQADTLIAVVLGDADPGATEDRYLVHFLQQSADSASAFTTKCGSCHRALTPAGPLGMDSIGPNLSGLLSTHYPTADGRGWDRDRLEHWLRNPRADRPGTLMRPVELRGDEFAQIVRALSPSPAR